jgi:predicted N-acetyltransferase YhbS
MAVKADAHRKGVGRALVKQAEIEARRKSAEFLMVKTLGESHPDPGYDLTRQFYLGVGFRPLQELGGIWKSNPCLILVKSLNAAEFK